MPDIVVNLLHLSSEATDVEGFLERALDLATGAANADAAAVALSTAPE